MNGMPFSTSGAAGAVTSSAGEKTWVFETAATEIASGAVPGEPAEPGVGAWLGRARLLCTVYDPRAGKYRLNYGLFIEIAVGLSVLGAIAFYLTAEWRRQRAARTA